ncbi:hypothetical protein CcCBS67573_g09967 [Chytriomyces confervae]|uniref:Uncharacterized protein n=1 Tax=Chytriomyces confervae TaxID=246404 RepID=A0A507DJZ8_9FUNG|nr:hypothetical protein HDU80_010723 [Chytriomyces hyalinus]TPX51982.1 hypothetical protein CcCBS67573_g09967 [Chytriomyces confervae]
MKHKASIPSIKPATATADATSSVLHSLLNVSSTPLKKPKTFKLNSDGDLLSRVASFLPQLKCANDQLEVQRAQGEILDIEHIEAAQDQHIEMDLGLGVFDYAPEDISKIAKPEILVKLPHGESSESDDEDIKLGVSQPEGEESAGVSSANAVQDLMRAVVEQQGHGKKKTRKKKRPLIQVLS